MVHKLKNKQTYLSSLKSFGITPQTVLFILLSLVFSGVILGLLVNSSNNSVKKRYLKQQSKIASISPEVKLSSNTDVKKEQVVSVNIVKEVPRQLFDENKVLVSEEIKTPVIALVIDDMGVDMLRTNKILNLPYTFTASYLTYAPNLQSQINIAKSKGKEILLHVPMEAISQIYDYGPEVLSTKYSLDENISLLNKMLDRVNGYIGINNHMGSKFTSDELMLSGVFRVLSERGGLFLDSKTYSKTKTLDILKYIDIPYAIRDVFLDDSNIQEDIEKSLLSVERIALSKGYVVVIGHPRDNTIKVLEKWLPTLKKKNLTLVPLSYIYDNFTNYNTRKDKNDRK